MSVSAQVFDFIFAGKLNEEEDLKLTDAVKDAGDVCLGLAFKLGKKNRSQKMKPGTSNENSYILQTSWDVVLEGNPETLYVAENPMMTYLELAFASRGLGSLSVKFDRDGVLRRVPLFVHYKRSPIILAAYGAVGTPINTAFRIESYTVGGQVLISPSTYLKMESLVKLKGTKEVQFEGIDHTVCLYDAAGIGGAYQIFLPEENPESLIEIDPAMPIECFPLEGKAISTVAISGRITGLGENSAGVELAGPIEPHTNLRILFHIQEAPGLLELYTKVLAGVSSEFERGD
jgi:hypothetical protein